MPGKGLRWGIAGYGDVVRKRVLPGLQALSETVACVWGRDAQRARALSDDYDIGFGTDDYNAMLESVDLVYVATPVATHVPLAGAALRAGLPVLVEMPLGLPLLFPPRTSLGPHGSTVTLDEADLTAGPVAAAAAYGRTAPALIRLRELLAGRTVHTISSSSGARFDPAPSDPGQWRTDPAVAGGGVLAAVGSHRLDLLLWLLGKPAEMTSEIGPRLARGAERRASLQLTWPQGTRGALAVDWSEGPRHDRLTVTFDGGYLEGDPLDSGLLRGRIDGASVRIFRPPHANPHVPLLADFARSVADGTVPVCPIDDAMIVDRLIAAAYADAPSTDASPDLGSAGRPAFRPTAFTRARSANHCRR
ncbi:Gfo/Idh/MocA family protein [Nonomuraea zeae]|uniref:Gfo/Idh/MocA family protein n=1 Tax=Nonomuraea zeae TaxID=1642303 RepID=UPI0036187639